MKKSIQNLRTYNTHQEEQKIFNIDSAINICDIKSIFSIGKHIL